MHPERKKRKCEFYLDGNLSTRISYPKCLGIFTIRKLKTLLFFLNCEPFSEKDHRWIYLSP